MYVCLVKKRLDALMIMHSLSCCPGVSQNDCTPTRVIGGFFVQHIPADLSRTKENAVQAAEDHIIWRHFDFENKGNVVSKCGRNASDQRQVLERRTTECELHDQLQRRSCLRDTHDSFATQSFSRAPGTGRGSSGLL